MKSKIKIDEIVVVEGRDDSAAVTRAADCHTIETHGFGIGEATWALIAKAAIEKGIIVLTDPDYAGEQIRKRIDERLNELGSIKHAYIARKDATRSGDVGVENASDEDIIGALIKAKASVSSKSEVFTVKDIVGLGLSGREDSRARREFVGRELGIGYANANGLLKKLNGFGITFESLEECLMKYEE